MSDEEIVQIVFPKSEKEDQADVKDFFNRLTMRGIEKNRIFNVEEILNWFKKLEVKEIELWIETSVKSGNILNLFISAEEKGGIKVTLIPKTDTN